MDELMSLASLEAWNLNLYDYTDDEILRGQIDKLISTARAAHELKAEVEKLNEHITLQAKAANNMLTQLLEQRSIINDLKEQLAERTRPVTDWRTD